TTAATTSRVPPPTKGSTYPEMTLSNTPTISPARTTPDRLSSPPSTATDNALMSKSDRLQSTPCTAPQRTPVTAATAPLTAQLKATVRSTGIPTAQAAR